MIKIPGNKKKSFLKHFTVVNMVKELSHYVRVTCLSNKSSGNIQRLVEEYAIAGRARTGGVYRVDPSPLWGIVEGKPQLTNAKQRKVKKSMGQ